MSVLNRLSPLILCLLLAGIHPTAHAEAEIDDEAALAALYGDAEMVSIATGTAKPVYRAPSVASVITAEDIEAMGARNIDEVLESVAGLHVTRSTFTRLDPVYGIRGIATATNPHTLMLINGIRFGNLHYSGRMPTFRLPVSNIERIEVIRGPGSAVYGADAYAGVINIITKSGKQASNTLTYRRGSFDTQDVKASLGMAWADWELGLNIENQKSDGDDERIIRSDLQSLLDAVFGTNASLAPAALQTNYDLLNTQLSLKNSHWNIRYWNWTQRDAGQGAGAADTIDPVGRQDIDHNLFDIGYRREDIARDWNVEAHYSYQHTLTESTFQLLPPGTVVPIGADGNINFVSPVGVTLFTDGLLGNPDSTEDIHFAEAIAEYVGIAGHRLRFSLGARRERSEAGESKNFGPGILNGTQPVVDGTLTDVTGTPYIFSPDVTRNVRFASVQDEWAFAPDWELTAGARYDHYSDFGSTINPRVALVWSTRYNLTTKFLYGKAFRAPSFSELYFINNPTAFGNSTLNPEEIDTMEVAFDYRPRAGLQFNLSIFQYRAKDLIEFIDPTGTTGKVAQNARDQDGQGLEAEMDWKITENWNLKSYYAYQDARDAETDEPIHDVPRKHAYANLTWRPMEALQGSVQVNWVSDRRRRATDPRGDIDDYIWTDLTVRAPKIATDWQLAASIRNVFDEEAREPSTGNIDDYPLESRSLWLEVAYRWQD